MIRCEWGQVQELAFLVVSLIVVRIEQVLILFAVEGNWTQFRGRKIIEGKFVGLHFERRSARLPLFVSQLPFVSCPQRVPCAEPFR